MATKKCPNGHKYDSDIYGDKCPFCPSNNGGGTAVMGGGTAVLGGGTAVTGGNTIGNFVPSAGASTQMQNQFSMPDAGYKPTMPMEDPMMGGEASGGHTVVRTVGNGNSPDPDGGRKVIGVVVSYAENPAGEVFKIFEGRNIIGRDATCDIHFGKDDKMSGKHICILYVEAEGVVWIEDQMSSNGTYVNSQFARGMVELHSGDVITAGNTKMVFLRVPEF